ncbi:T9SS type A sorting domain-containing protein [Chryseobacterium taichungense]|uniref:T9SS type A sorting domain-containing protein n=1 Tax=Chryseobacterium taichungense TaxID=295069 RepID=UPI0028A6734A|nr:T9SS type A sorting domain-containing protein [Chryseobacterium taichungense]
MRKNLFAIGLIAAIYSVQAQNILVHLDDSAVTYVSEGTLLYSGGGFQTRGSGIMDVHGNIMIDGQLGDAFKTITTGGSNKTDGGNIVLRLNDPDNYLTSTYGQLYINGIQKTYLTGTVSKEYRTSRHGNVGEDYFQQISLPFADKIFGTLSTELNKTFTTARWSKNEILRWDNRNVVARHITNLGTTTSSSISGYNDPYPYYYTLGSKNNNLDLSTPPTNLPTISPTPTGSVFTINGAPVYSEGLTAIALQDAGLGINFGTNGNNMNQYNEKYNSYLQDKYDNTTAGYFLGTYGRNIYQFGNPYFTNLDLSNIPYNETGGVTGSTDGNFIDNIWAIKYSPGTVTSYPGVVGTFTTGIKTVTYDQNRIPTGDVNGLIIKPMETFVIKLRDNTPKSLNFTTLRRFAGTARDGNTDYSVTAAKGIPGTVKQLGIIALDAQGKEIGRTYYVVSPNATTGHQTSAVTSIQASATGGDAIGTFEESPNGGYDYNYVNYWLYINEANENNFQGKNVKLMTYSLPVVKSYKFEIRENAQLVPNGTHALSTGIGFYYKAENGTVQQAVQGAVIPVLTAEYDLYYGEPSNVVLAVDQIDKTPSRTLVVYNPAVDDYIVRFDPNWKKADVDVYDMSGKLVISKKSIDTSKDFVIELDKKINNVYVVKVVSEKGDVVNAKILK